MQLEQGLFKLDFSDYHAVLGIPVSADAKVVRKRYLTIARKLHPDSLSTASTADKQRASELLSKWVNPAYEVLSQDKPSTEHQLVLKLKGQTLGRATKPPEVDSEPAKQLIKAPHVDAAYRQAVNALASEQYDKLDSVLQIIGQLSELNMMYLYRTASSAAASQRSGVTPKAQASPTSPTATPAAPPPKSGTAPPPPRRSQSTILDSYINRAQEHEQSQDYGQAVLEMREAIKTYPQSARCHSYLASLYLKTGQVTMARVHAKRALEITPDNELAKTIQTRLARAGGASGKSGTTAKGSDKSSGGFFGLFGGKKKS